MLELTLPSLDFAQWAVVLFALVLVGFAKTGISGAGTVAIALFALVLPTKSSTGMLLPLLLVGDVVAVVTYRRHADWPRLLKLFPWVAVGVVVGAFVVRWVDDAQMRRIIGTILLVIIALHFWNRSRGSELAEHRAVAASAGVFAGFTTMTANAAGPIMAVYFLAAGLPMLGFLGTTAWFFLTINAFKVPFSVALGLITPATLTFAAVTAPAVVAGGVVGRVIVKRINRTWFERMTLALTFLAAIRLMF
ncbi:TSUP family transporter [Sphaerisporangium dianthi]|uniref:Probable membrane transporter protein n=1 Tax=Sphaerisporangium dianthi TaxID=1436120 RepID=A0ABV9C8R3_9ACTN